MPLCGIHIPPSFAYGEIHPPLGKGGKVLSEVGATL